MAHQEFLVFLDIVVQEFLVTLDILALTELMAQVVFLVIQVFQAILGLV